MSKIDDNLSEILDIDNIQIPEIIEDSSEKSLEVISKDTLSNDIDLDTEYARKNIKKLIRRGNVAFDQLMRVAELSEHPRAYEVLATMFKNLSEMNKDLLDLHKKKKDLAPKDYSKNQNISVDKAVVFTGSTKELLQIIKENK